MTFQKGHKLATGRPPGSKNVTTLLREERRAIFEEEISQKWHETIEKLPPVYIADQFMGKAPDLSMTLNLDANITQNDRELGTRLIGLLG